MFTILNWYLEKWSEMDCYPDGEQCKKCPFNKIMFEEEYYGENMTLCNVLAHINDELEEK